MGCGEAHNLTRTRYKPSQIVKLQPLYEEWKLDKGNNFIAGLRLKKCRKTFFKTDKDFFRNGQRDFPISKNALFPQHHKANAHDES